MTEYCTQCLSHITLYMLSKELGDFQTPPALVDGVLQCLGSIGKVWPRVLEPTCGSGNFITGLLNLAVPPREIQAIEIQETYFQRASKIAQQSLSTRVFVKQANLFNLKLRKDLKWSETGSLLVVGNPPWVTNSQLGTLGSQNLPLKTNLKALRGIEALTGHSNFDIAEYIWIKLIRELADEQPAIALLCKTSVARNVLQFAFDAALPITGAFIRMIDAKKWFGATVSACLFYVEVGAGARCYEAPVYRDLNATEPDYITGIAGGQVVADVKAYQRSAFADGVCSVTWRQGLKHDAASVMELTYNASGGFQNKLGEKVVVESEYIYPLIKSTDLYKNANVKPQRAVIVTQKRPGEDTRQLQQVAPQLWNYLTAQADIFERRKSSIYRGKPPFSMFGIGDYSFALYKVGISGLHKTPRFRAIAPVDGRPVMLDDTCYFIACDSPEQAAFLASLLNSPACLDFILSCSFSDAKRPVTKKLLGRINLKALLDRIDIQSLLSQANVEFERLETRVGQQTPEWPLSLDKFLVGFEVSR